MSGLAALGNYIDSGSEDEDNNEGYQEKRNTTGGEEEFLHLKASKRAGSSSLVNAVVAAPSISLNASLDQRRHLDPTQKEVKYNPK